MKIKTNLRHLGLLGAALTAIALFSYTLAPSVYADSGYTWTNETTGTSLSATGWAGIASSASGKYVVASNGNLGIVAISSNYGQTWANATSSLGTQSFGPLTISSSGQYIYANTSNGHIYASSDYGQTWSDVASSIGVTSDWNGIATSATGKYVVAGLYQGSNGVYVSNDYGQTWIHPTSGLGTIEYVTGMAMSDSGQYMSALSLDNGVYVSNDYGQTWAKTTTVAPNPDWFGITMSSGGQYQYANNNFGNLYISTDYGQTWTQNMNPPAVSFYTITTSATGQYIATGGNGSEVYTSDDYGQTWTDASSSLGFGSGASWDTLTMSNSGQYLYATNSISTMSSHTGDLYSANNPSLATTPPQLKLQTVSVTMNGSIVVDVLNGVTGADTATLSIVSGPSHGTAVDPPGTITYTPATGYVGADSLVYQVCSALDNTICSQATLRFSVVSSLSAPDTGYGQPNHIDPVIIIAFFLAGLIALGYGWRTLRQSNSATD